MAKLVHPLFVVLALLPWTWLTAAHFEDFSHGQGSGPGALSDSPATPYAAWLAGYGLSPSGEGGLEADPDDDGHSNASEFAFGGNPVAPDGALMQIAVGGEDVIVTSFVRRQGPYASATYLIEQSEDLRSGWTTYVPASMTVSTEGVADPVHYEHVEFTTPAGNQGFFRVKATIDLAPPQPDQSADPSPSSETTNVSTAPVLAWSGNGAEVSYDVYLGLPGQMVFQTNQPTTVFAPDLLQHNTTYHWRIDTRNDYGVTTGKVWTFSTAVRPAGLTFLGAGEAAGGEGPVAPTLPEGLAPGDLLVLMIQSSGPR
jgi:hypothetical protein